MKLLPSKQYVWCLYRHGVLPLQYFDLLFRYVVFWHLCIGFPISYLVWSFLLIFHLFGAVSLVKACLVPWFWFCPQNHFLEDKLIMFVFSVQVQDFTNVFHSIFSFFSLALAQFSVMKGNLFSEKNALWYMWCKVYTLWYIPLQSFVHNPSRCSQSGHRYTGTHDTEAGVLLAENQSTSEN